ncbi:MAG: RcnB family protein [Comamonas sp.]|uniref:RcnB family protein n=1 Tax=Comamonas sp. TaxID=34028 RepID=UPI002FC88439
MTHNKSIQSGLWALAAGVALTAFAPLASAQPRQEPQRGGPQMHQPEPGHGPAQMHQPVHQHQPAAKPGHGPGHVQAGGPHRGAGPDRNLHRGGKLPPSYRSKHYIVDDWRGHGLQRPGRGQHWVQVGSDYLLVAAATGLIAQIVLH